MSNANQESHLHFRTAASLALLGAIAGSFVWACVGTSSNNTGTGGTAGTAGNTGGSTSSNASAGGSAGTANTNAGGSTSAGASSCASVTGAAGAVACPKPTTALITDFTYIPSDGGSITDASFGDYTTTLSGGTYVYPSTLTSNITGGNWHVSGTVNNYSGIGVFFNKCYLLDASAYKGISFTISGTVGTTNAMTLGVPNAADTISSAWYAKYDAGTVAPNFGQCNPPSSNQYDGSCGDPQKVITVTTTPTKVTVLWSDLTGGKPQESANPCQISGNIYLFFPWSTSTTAYNVDIIVDDISFVP